MMKARVTELPDPGDGLGPNPKIVLTIEGTAEWPGGFDPNAGE